MRNVPTTKIYTIPCAKCGGLIGADFDIHEYGFRYLSNWSCIRCGSKIKGYTYYEKEDKWIWEYEED